MLEAARQSTTKVVTVELLLRLASRRRSSLSLSLVTARTFTRTRYRFSYILSLGLLAVLFWSHCCDPSGFRYHTLRSVGVHRQRTACVFGVISHLQDRFLQSLPEQALIDLQEYEHVPQAAANGLLFLSSPRVSSVRSTSRHTGHCKGRKLHTLYCGRDWCLPPHVKQRVRLREAPSAEFQSVPWNTFAESRHWEVRTEMLGLGDTFWVFQSVYSGTSSPPASTFRCLGSPFVACQALLLFYACHAPLHLVFTN